MQIINKSIDFFRNEYDSNKVKAKNEALIKHVVYCYFISIL